MSDAKAFSLLDLKTEAKSWREQRHRLGKPATHGAALEFVARQHGFRDWNTACALLPRGEAVPIAVGDRVQGHYLGNAFHGVVLATKPLGAGHASVTVRFDEPINVSGSTRFSHMRQRVTATLDESGTSPARTSDGRPHLSLSRA